MSTEGVPPAKDESVSDEASAAQASDRRGAERSRVAIRHSRGGASSGPECTGNLSSGGLFVETREEYTVATRVLVTLTLPTGRIRAMGVIRWVRPATDRAPPGVGIAFDGLPSSKRSAIEAFCRRAAAP
jgi:uncharacterized protein (TIGR02266 family)